MFKRILNWRWLPPLTYVLILVAALIATYFTDRDDFVPVLLCVTLLLGATIIMMVIGKRRPDVLNAYLGGRVIERQPRQNPDVISALEQLTLAVEQCDDGHTPKPIHDAAARARDALDKLKPRS